MGYWINVDSTKTTVHRDTCRHANPTEKTEGDWHYVETYPSLMVDYKTKNPCMVCRPDRSP